MNCAKCRQCKAQGNDSWCQGCTALEALNTELHARWSIPALRCVANDIVVSAIRAVSALRTVAGSIESAGASRAATRSAEQPQASGVDRRHSGDTHRERSRAPLPRVKSPPPSTDGESEEEEESEEDSPLVTGAAGNQILRDGLRSHQNLQNHHILHESIVLDIEKKINTVRITWTIVVSSQEGENQARRGKGVVHAEEPSTQGSTGCWTTLNWLFISDHQGVTGNQIGHLLAKGRARTDASMDRPSGKEYRLEDITEWNNLAVEREDIVEVHLPSTNVECGGDLWAGFWVKQVLIQQHGDYVAHVRSLGCSDPDWSRWLSGRFNRRVGSIHFCASKPCVVVDEYTLHVTRVRIFDLAAFERSYMNTYTKRQIAKWVLEPFDEIGEAFVDVTGATPGASRGRRWRWQGQDRRATLGPQSQGRHAQTHSWRQGQGRCWRRRQEETRRRETGWQAPSNRGGEDTPTCSPGTCSGKDAQQAASSTRWRWCRARCRSCQAGRALTFPRLFRLSCGGGESEGESPGTRPFGAEPTSCRTPERPLEEASRGRRTYQEEEEGRWGPCSPREGSREVTKDGTLRTLQTQLVLKAQEIAQEKAQKEREEKKRHHRKDPSYKLAKILTLAVQGGRKRRGGSEGSGSSSGRHPKDKKKKKKKKRRGKPKRDGSDPSSPRGSSPTGSSGDSWVAPPRVPRAARRRSSQHRSRGDPRKSLEAFFRCYFNTLEASWTSRQRSESEGKTL